MSPYKCCANCTKGSSIPIESVSDELYLILVQDPTGRNAPFLCGWYGCVRCAASCCPLWEGSTLDVPWEAQKSLGGIL